MDVRTFRRPPDLTPRQALSRAQAVVLPLPLLPYLHALLKKKTGRPPALSPAQFLTICLYYALLRPKDDMHLTKALETLHQMPPSLKYELGVPNKITYRQFHYAFTRIVRALADEAGRHNHTTVDDQTGEILKCPATCPAGQLSSHNLLNQFLAGSIPAEFQGHTDYAIDGTAYPTWAKRGHLTKMEIDDQNVPDLIDLYAHSDGTEKPLNFPKHSKVNAIHASRPRYTKDPDALAGYRTASNDQPGSPYVGYEIHILTNLPPIGSLVPYLIQSSTIVSAGSSRADAGIQTIDAFHETHQKADADSRRIICLVADRGYSMLRAETWQYRLWERGIDQVFDLASVQRHPHPGPIPGTIIIDGGLYTEALPEVLRNLPRANKRGASKEEQLELAARADERERFAFRPHGARDPRTGAQRWKGPALSGDLRCPNNARSLRGPHNLPLTACKPGCACSKTFTWGPEDGARERQWPHFSTTKWLESYLRRNAVESVNAEIKTHRGDIRRGYTHVFGLSKNTLLMAFGFAAINIHILRDWHFNRHEQDPWSTQPDEEPWDFGIKPPQTRALRRIRLRDLIRT